MGDPKHSRRKYEKPSHPWQEQRIQNENDYVKHYGLKNKKEFWKARSKLKKIRGEARNLQARLRYGDKQATKEMEDLIEKLTKNGYIKGEDITLDDILNLTVENILNRRLQSLVYHKGLAHTPRQSRQLITHGHIKVGDGRVTVPSYIVGRDEEPTLDYHEQSPLSDELHPERPEEETSPMTIPEKIKKEEQERYQNRRR